MMMIRMQEKQANQWEDKDKANQLSYVEEVFRVYKPHCATHCTRMLINMSLC